MTKSMWFLVAVLTSTLLSSSAFAQIQSFINVYPHPIQNESKISFDNKGDVRFELKQVTIFDLTGTAKLIIPVEEFSCGTGRPETEIEHRNNFSTYPNGIYLIEYLYLFDGEEKKFTGRIIVSK